MSGTFRLARRYIGYHRVRTAILLACIALTIYLPVATRLGINQFQRRAIRRAQSTPLVIGAKGSRFGLVIHALHFRGDPPEAITMAEVDGVDESGLAEAIPLLARFQARGHTIAGTTARYYEFRQLSIARGGPLKRLGDCVLGARVARVLGLGPGDRLLSEPENVFDLTGPSPLNMSVVGVLNPARSADDDAVFTDLRTTWLIQGIGHGHDPLSGETDSDDQQHQHKASKANLVQSAEVNDENLHTFHFHGEPDTFPLTAIIALPRDEKSETLLMGQYLSQETAAQALKPVDVVGELMEIVLRVRRLFDIGTVLMGLVTALLVALVMLLSLRLRSAEMEMMFKLGCSRTTILRIQAAELGLVLAVSMMIAAVFLIGTAAILPSLIDRLIG